MAPEVRSSISQLITVEDDKRDDQWRQALYRAITLAEYKVDPEAIQFGPDDFPYLILQAQEGDENEDVLSFHEVLGEAVSEEVGLVIKAPSGDLAWVFSFGSLWAYQEFQRFESQPDDSVVPPLKEGESREILVAAPSEEFLPSNIRDALRNFLSDDLGVDEPKMFMVVDPAYNPPQALVFSVFPEDFENHDEFEMGYSRLGWFLPDWYRLGHVSEDSDLREHFQAF